MERKGISPLIAAVLLIAFTMAVASLFAQWAPQLIKSAQGDTTNKSATIQRCSQNVMEVTQGNSTHVTVQQVAGESGVGNVSFTWFYQDAPPAQGYGTFDNSRQALRSSDGTNNNLDYIRIQPVNCEGSGVTTYSP